MRRYFHDISTDFSPCLSVYPFSPFWRFQDRPIAFALSCWAWRPYPSPPYSRRVILTDRKPSCRVSGTPIRRIVTPRHCVASHTPTPRPVRDAVGHPTHSRWRATGIHIHTWIRKSSNDKHLRQIHGPGCMPGTAFAR
jgi:hypothetical protein